jgi:hypothetical protein
VLKYILNLRFSSMPAINNSSLFLFDGIKNRNWLELLLKITVCAFYITTKITKR